MQIKILIINFSYFIQKSILNIFSFFLFPNKPKFEEINKILIFRTGTLGDNLCALPAINSIRLKYPEKEIHILYHSGETPALSIVNIINNEIIDKFIDYRKSKIRPLMKKLKTEKYTVFVEFPQVHAKLISRLRNILFAKLIGVKYIAKQVVLASHIFPQTQSNLKIFKSIRVVFFDISRSIGAENTNCIFPLKITDTDKQKVKELILKKKITNKQKNIAVIVGAKRSQNLWPVSYFKIVSNYFSDKGYNIIFIGGKKETSIVNELLLISNTFDFTGKLNPIQSGLLMQNCLLTITNDTGPMHLSYAFGTYTIAIFSSRDYPNLWFPPKNKGFVFRNNNINCHSCFSETCNDNICMKEIKPEIVIKKVEQVIKNTSISHSTINKHIAETSKKMPKKKILVFIDWFLPGYKAGGPIRSVANLTAHLSGEFEFFILTRNTDYLETLPYPNIQANKWVDLSENIKVYYFSSDKLNIRNIKNTAVDVNADVVYINGVYSFYFSLLPVWFFRKSDKKVIVATRGMLSGQSFTYKSLKKLTFVKVVRFLGFYKNICFHVTNSMEEKYIQQLNLNPKEFITAPNLASKTINIQHRKTKGRLKLIFIARIEIKNNLLFALRLLTENSFQGNIEYCIYGPIYQYDYWQDCLDLIKQKDSNVEISYNGILDNKKIPEVIQNYHFAFLPTLGENFGHSILESLSFACPVIISDQTPWRNLEEKKVGWDISLNDEEKFIKTIQYCIDMDQEEYNKWSGNAYRFATEFANNPELIEQSRKLFVT